MTSSKIKFTKELIYIMLDRLPYGPFGFDITNEKYFVVGENKFYHSYSKLYILNGEIVCFRKLWEFLCNQNINEITNITYKNKIYPIELGYINIPELCDISNETILNDLLWRIKDTGSTLGDDVITKEIFDKFIWSKNNDTLDI